MFFDFPMRQGAAWSLPHTSPREFLKGLRPLKLPIFLCPWAQAHGPGANVARGCSGRPLGKGDEGKGYWKGDGLKSPQNLHNRKNQKENRHPGLCPTFKTFDIPTFPKSTLQPAPNSREF